MICCCHDMLRCCAVIAVAAASLPCIASSHDSQASWFAVHRPAWFCNLTVDGHIIEQDYAVTADTEDMAMLIAASGFPRATAACRLIA